MNGYSQEFKLKAILLRKQGFSYNEIRKSVAVAKSTLSLWLKDVLLSAEHRKRLYTRQINILSRGSQSQKERRAREVAAIIKKAEEEVRLPISLDTYRLVGACLYWAEGSKGKMLQITNSDPAFILFFVRWLDMIFGIPASELGARMNIYPQQNENNLKRFWSDLTGIPLSNFGKSYIKPMSMGYKKNNLYYGTMRLEVPKSVDLHYRLFGWIRRMLQEVDPQLQRVQKKWKSLREVARPVNILVGGKEKSLHNSMAE